MNNDTKNGSSETSVHVRIKNIEFHVFDKLFGAKGTLKIHVKAVHEGIKEFKCQECGKTFSHRWSWINHKVMQNRVIKIL